MSSSPQHVHGATRTRHENRRQLLFLVLAAFFLTNALLAELVGGKLFGVTTGLGLLGQENYRVIMSSGILLWPVVFIMTDVINEYFGRQGVRRLSILGAGMIAYTFVMLWLTGMVEPVDFSPVDADSFNTVFRQSRFIIAGSIIAFLLAQLIDVAVFWLIRRQTGARHLWLRATGSTLVSQLIDTFVVGFIGLYLPFALHQWRPESFAAGGVSFTHFLEAQGAGYVFKVAVAIGITPLLYFAHAIIDRFLGTQAEAMIEAAAAAEQS